MFAVAVQDNVHSNQKRLKRRILYLTNPWNIFLSFIVLSLLSIDEKSLLVIIWCWARLNENTIEPALSPFFSYGTIADRTPEAVSTLYVYYYDSSYSGVVHTNLMLRETLIGWRQKYTSTEKTKLIVISAKWGLTFHRQQNSQYWFTCVVGAKSKK